MSIDAAARPVSAADLVGAWELVSWTKTDAAGRITYPFTAEVRGRLIYDAGGLMAGFLMSPLHLSQPDAPGHKFISYSGRYALNGDVVEHAVDLAADPNWVGVTLRRRVVPQGEGMVLETLAAAGRAERQDTHRLTWRRA